MLQKIAFLPGFNKQITPTGAESQWVGGENVRFRYPTAPEVQPDTLQDVSFTIKAGTSLWKPKRRCRHRAL